ncbi:MAG: response regulator [Chloroflexota bacterium]|nr:response regulator [Chloroflexota bacterium]NOG64156.1 response regulator [Chloroflexota bacterium]GIK65789.1 MAG: response regulator [Chloroflexota bacterium]
MPARILYIEDNFENRLLVRRILLAEGYEFEEADNAELGIQLALKNPPDLILMDISMPNINGLTATRMIRESSALQRIPVVALTANAMQSDLDTTLEAGCDGYIIKPIDIDRFSDQILHYLRSRKSV